MRAVVVDTRAPGRLVLGEVPEPTPAANEAVVAVKAFSLNRGEVRTAVADMPDVFRPGWDFSGVVERAAADGSGPPKGARVVGMLFAGAWAERIAVPAAMLAEIPDAVSFEAASTLPVAGLTAVHALRKGGDLKGRKVLITGASGGVGVFAIQLAAMAGAVVTAAIRNTAHEGLVKRLGATHAAIGDIEAARAFGPFNLVLESIGGQVLGTALSMLAPGATCVLFGASETSVTTFDAKYYRVGGTSLYGLFLGYELQSAPPAADLAALAARIGDGVLDPMIEARADWSDIARIADDLMARRFSGKAVLSVG